MFPGVPGIVSEVKGKKSCILENLAIMCSFPIQLTISCQENLTAQRHSSKSV